MDSWPPFWDVFWVWKHVVSHRNGQDARLPSFKEPPLNSPKGFRYLIEQWGHENFHLLFWGGRIFWLPEPHRQAVMRWVVLSLVVGWDGYIHVLQRAIGIAQSNDLGFLAQKVPLNLLNLGSMVRIDRYFAFYKWIYMVSKWVMPFGKLT